MSSGDIATGGNPLVAVEPSQTLTFKLERGAQPRTVLKLSNISNQKVVFKVKTTQPAWYYVRPNQQILDIGQTEDVNILLVEAECNRFLDQYGGNGNTMDIKHRFLVQSRVIDDEDFERIRLLSTTEKTEELNKLWDGASKDDKRNIKLKVEFKLPERVSSLARSAPAPVSGSESAAAGSFVSASDSLRSRLHPSSSSSGTAGAGAPSTSGASSGVPASLLTSNNTAGGGNGIVGSSSQPELLFAELQSLRKKYDAVVEYTVHLSSERDGLVAQLEALQRELAKEKAKKKEGNGSSKGGDKNDKRVIERGFSLGVILITALICFILGKYFR